MKTPNGFRQDVSLSLEVDQDKHEQKYVIVAKKNEGINGIQETNPELLIKDKTTRQLSSDFLVTDTFEWKPGLQRWLTLLEAFKDSGTIVHFALMSD